MDARAKADTVGAGMDDSVGEYLQLSQDNFVLNENWQMDNTLGDFSLADEPTDQLELPFQPRFLVGPGACLHDLRQRHGD